MKIAFSSTGETLEAPLDSRFGRAQRFVVFDTDTSSFETIDNQAQQDAAHGAGIQAAERLARLGVSGLVTGNCGPKAFEVLSRAGVKVYQADACTVADALRAHQAGTLALLEPASAGTRRV